MYYSVASTLFLASCALARAVDHPAQRRSASGPRESTPAGCLTVKASGASSGEYSSLGAAIPALGTGSSSESACIFMYAGTYSEQVTISDYEGKLTLYGYTSDMGIYNNNEVTITHSETSEAAGSDENSSTLAVNIANFEMYNINVVNSYGAGAQAVALTANGNQQGYYGCQIKGWQDTLYAKSGYQYYKYCYIEGGVDWIFGDAAAWFTECIIAAKAAGGSVTASSRGTSTDPAWYVIDSTSVRAAEGYDSLDDSVYLGRPWGLFARVIYQYCDLSDIIATVGWTTMSAGATPVFEEYDNSGAGSSTSGREMETTATGPVTMAELWPNGYSWINSTF